MRDTPVLLVLIAVLTGTLLSQSPVPGRSEATRPEAKSLTATTGSGAGHRDTGSADGEALTLLRAFFGSSGSDGFEAVRQASRKHAVRFLVATVPDPVDSNTNWFFDRFVGSIQRAAEASGFVLNSFKFPRSWVPQSPGESAGVHPAAEHEHEPAVILFRAATLPPSGSPDQMLLVFLIPEMATAGVSRSSLLSTFEFIERVQGAGQPLLILGPTFSGSVPSLRRALQAWFDGRKGERTPIRIVSGTATDPANHKHLQTDLSPLPVTYRATVLPADLVLNTTLAYLIDTNEELSSIAMLVESNTAYGQAVASTLERRNRVKQHQVASPTAGRQEVVQRPRDANVTIATFPFPLHISRVRRLADASRSHASQTQGPINPFVSPLLMGDAGDSDALPAMTPDLTASSVELALQEILVAIQRDHIEAVGLIATDVRDKLFLAREISRYCPDVTLLTTDSELFYTHPDYVQQVRGMLIGSTYPLFPVNQIWTSHFDGQPRLQFNDDANEGIYNAVVALLNYDENGAPSRRWLARAPMLLEYSQPFTADCHDRCYPPVWISTVGNSGRWPLRVTNWLSHPDSPKIQEMLFSPRTPADSSSARASVALHASGWAIASALALMMVSFLHCWSFERARLCELPLLRGIFPSHGTPGAWGHQFVCSAMLLALNVLVLQCLATWLSSAQEGWSALAVAWPLLVGANACAIWLVRVCVMLVWKRDASFLLASTSETCPATSQTVRRWDGWIRGGIINVGIALVLWFLARWIIEHSFDPIFFERAINAESGLTPVVPVVAFAAVIYLWGSIQLRELHRGRLPVDLGDVRRGGLDLELLALGGCGPSLKRLHDLSGNLGLGLPWPMFLGGVCVAAASFVLVFRHANLTVEGHLFNHFVQSSMTLFTLLTTLALCHFASIWLHLRRCLARLSAHEVGCAYGHLPEEAGHSVSGILSLATPTLLDLKMPVRRWGDLLSAVSRLSPASVLVASSAPVANLQGYSSVPQSMAALVAGVQAVSAAQRLNNRTLLGMPALHQVPDEELVDTLLDHELRRPVPPAWSDSDTWTELVKGFSALQPLIGSPAATMVAPADLVRQVQEYVVMLGVLTIRDALARLGNALMFIAGAVLLVLLSVTSFPIQSRHLLLGFGWAAVLVAITTVLIVLVQVDRNVLLGRVAKHPSPGHLSWDRAFVSKLVVYVAAPLLSLFATQFPDFARPLIDWLAPIQKALP